MAGWKARTDPMIERSGIPPAKDSLVQIRIVYTGRGYQLADLLPDSLELGQSATVEEALRALREHLPDSFQIPDSCLVAVRGTHLGTVARHQSLALRDGDELTLIAPVAGG